MAEKVLSVFIDESAEKADTNSFSKSEQERR